MFAVINTNGVQFVVTPGERIKVMANLGEKGKEIEFDKVMMIKDNEDTVVGRPYVEGAKVRGVIRESGHLPKVVVFKFRRKEKYRRKRGHRQDFSEIEITDIIK